MPRPNISEILKGRDTSGTWQCSCGREGPWRSIVAHRKGRKGSKRHPEGRPECMGPMSRMMSASSEMPRPLAGSGMPDSPQSSQSPQMPEGRPLFDGYEFLPGEEPSDPEAVARRHLEQLRREAEGHAAEDIAGTPGLPEGDWQIEAPREESPVSQSRESVSLPITTRVMYDWFRANGWHQGDGSLSAWVTDVINTFWVHVLGKAIVVVDREEVMADAGARA